MTQEEWNAIKNNDTAYDGIFFYGTKKNRTVCVPSCASKQYDPRDIIIFSSLAAAREAGFRSCSRCRPDIPGWRGAKNELAQKAKAYMEAHFRDKFSLEQMADALFINKYYLARAFKEAEGCTPLWYHNLTRCRKACKLLEKPEYSVTYISDTTGFATSSHFARTFKACFGITPSGYRKNYFKRFK